MKELAQLTDDEKLSLYKKIRILYPWCVSPKNIARLAKVEINKLGKS